MITDLGQLLRAAFGAIQRRDFQSAETLVNRALEAAPGSPDVNRIAGMLAAQTGNFGEARSRFGMVLEGDANDFDALVGLSYVLHATGAATEAMETAERAHRIRPGDPGVLNTLGLCRLQAGDSQGALTAFEAALRVVPMAGALHRHKGDALERLHRDSEALSEYKTAYELDPNDFQARIFAAGLMLVHGTLEDALGQVKKALQLSPNWTPALLLAARIYAEARKPELAESHFAQAAAADSSAELPLAVWLIEEGRLSEAKDVLARVLSREPTNQVALYWMTEARNLNDPGDPLIAQLEDLGRNSQLAPGEKAIVHYALGRTYDRAKRYESAIAHLDEANRLAYATNFPTAPNLKSISLGVDDAIRYFPAGQIGKDRVETPGSERPIFIVGMMRSGTTLLEQIVSSHPEVAAAGELRYWLERGPEAIRDARRRPKLAADYLELLKRIEPNSKRITDKTPLNYQFLGMLSAVLPKAKILHIRRNPIDTCLSVYMMVYTKPPTFANSQENIAFAYREYQRLMRHWRSVLPKSNILELDYEELVGNQEPTTRKIIDFLELEWDDACLRPDQNESAVRTPSMMQVRQPVYKTSMDRWRNYEPWLGALLELRD